MSETHDGDGQAAEPGGPGGDAFPGRAPVEPASNWLTELVAKAAAREMGQAPDPVRVQGHHGAVLLGSVAYETAVTRFDALEPHFRKLASLQAARIAGCPW